MKALALTVVVVLFCSACSRAGGNNDKSVADLVTFLGTRQLEVTARQEKIAPLIGASDGSGLVIAGDAVEVYKFDSDVPAQKALLEKYSSSGLDVMGEKYPVIVNGSFILLVDEKHPDWERIKAAFLAF